MFQPVLTPLKMASPMGLATPHNLMFQPVLTPLKMASPMGLANIGIQKWQVPWDLPLPIT